MDFRLSPEQEMFKDSIRRTLQDLGPDATVDVVRSALVELGATSVGIDEELGGLGGSPVETGIIMMELGRSLSAVPFIPSIIHAGTVLTELNCGADLLEGLLNGTRRIVMAHEEHGANGNPWFVNTQAQRGSNGYVLTGAKSVVVGGDEADTFLVTARATDDAFQGIGLFRIDAGDVDVKRFKTIDGYGAADLVMDSLEVDEDALMAVECDEALAKGHDAAIVAVSAEALGAMEAAFWITNDYLKTRKQFGSAIGSFQALQHRMADHYVELEQCRSMLYRSIAAAITPGADNRRVAAATKAFVGERGNRLGADMVQLHGGIGVSEEHMVGKYYRRLFAIEMRYGDSHHHLQRFAAS
jgi:hypothetical protein